MADAAPIASTRGSTPFITRLESLRGVAAVSVAIYHSFLVFHADGAQAAAATWIGRVFNGSAAVTLFFVLSGFVLGLSLRNASADALPSTARFGVRRLFRIYPVFLLSTLVVLGCLWCSARFGWPLPAWFGSSSGYHSGVLHPSTPPGAAIVISNLLLWSPSLNLVTWTLGIELRCSVLLPLLHWWSGKLSLRGRCLLLLGMVFAACLPKWCLLLGSARAETVLSLVHWAFSGYLFLFYLGYLLPEIGPALFNAVNKSPGNGCFRGRHCCSSSSRSDGATNCAFFKARPPPLSSAICSTGRSAAPTDGWTRPWPGFTGGFPTAFTSGTIWCLLCWREP